MIMYSAITVLAHVGDGDGYHHMWGDGAWGWVWGVVMMAAMVAVVGALVVWLARGGGQGPKLPPPDATHDARAILARRLAEGEIDPDEYNERLSHLR